MVEIVCTKYENDPFRTADVIKMHTTNMEKVKCIGKGIPKLLIPMANLLGFSSQVQTCIGLLFWFR